MIYQVWYWHLYIDRVSYLIDYAELSTIVPLAIDEKVKLNDWHHLPAIACVIPTSFRRKKEESWLMSDNPLPTIFL